MMLYILKVQFWTTSSVFWMVFAFATASKINENRIPNRLELVLLFWSLVTSTFYRFWIDFGSHLGSFGVTFGRKTERGIRRTMDSEPCWSKSLLRDPSDIHFWTILDLQHLPKSIQNRSKSYQVYVMTLYLRMARCSYDPLSFWPPALMASSANVWCCIALRCVVLLRVLFLCCVLLSCLMLSSVAFPGLCCSVH